MPSIYTYPRIDELSLKNLLIVSEAGGRNSRGIVYSTKSTTLGEIVELVVDTLAVGDFDEGIRNSQIDIQTDLLSLKSDTTVLKSRIDNVEGGTSTYATNTRVDEVKSTLEGSIASSTLSLEAGYRSYTDDALTSYSTSTATQQLITEATADKATAQSVTDLRSEIQTDLGNYSTTTATQSLITTATADLATSQSVTDLSSEIYGELGNYSTTTATQALITTATADKATSQSVTDLSSRIFDPTTNTLSQSFANSVMTTESTTDYAEASDVTELQSQFTFDASGGITGTSGALNTEIAAASSNTSQAFATKVSNLEAQFTLNNGVPDGLSSSNIQAIQTVIAGDGYATSTDITTLNSAIGQNSADISTVNTTIANETSARTSAISALQTDVNGNTADISSNTTAISNETSARISADQALQTNVNNNTAGISNNATLISNETSARASAISALQTDVNGNAADIASNLTAISNETSARVAAIQTLTTNVAGNAADISSNTTAISDEESARISADQALQTSVSGNTANISNNASAISTETSARASAISALQTTVNGNTASITNNATAISNETSARASAVSGLQTSINGNTASIAVNQSTIATVDGKLNSSYGIEVDANGVVAGLKLLSNGTTSDMEFAADKFKFTNGSGTLTPFSIDTVNNKINFTGDVVFSSGGNYGDSDVQSYIDTVGEIFTSTTTISGGQITTGLIKNSTYPHSASHSGFSTTGMAIDLDNGSIHAKEFFVDSDGTSSFKGSHSAGSIGNWVVHQGGQLKSSASSPSIVLSPNATGYIWPSEKIRISAASLPTISPSAGSSINFNSKDYENLEAGFSDISDRSTGSNTWFNATSSTHSTNTSYNKYISLPDITYEQNAVATTNNTTYTQHAGGSATFTVPYKSGADVGSFDIMVQEEFLEDHGASWYYSSGQSYSSWNDYIHNGNYEYERSNPSLNKYSIIESKYKIYLIAQVYEQNGGNKTPVGSEKSHFLKAGNIRLNLNDFIIQQYSDGSVWEGFEDLRNAMESSPHHYAHKSFGSWDAGSADFTHYLPAGDYLVEFKLKIQIYNTKLWGTSNHSDTGYASGTRYYAFANGGWYGSGTNSNALSQVVFKGSDPKTTIGINGTQIRGADGYIALGDVTSTDSIAQFWGNVEIIGGLTTNSTSIFSDERLKENIKPIKNPLQTIELLNPVTYKWNTSKLNKPGFKHGFIAQEVRDIVPSAVIGERKVADLEDALALEYNNFIAINTAAIKKLIEKIEALEQEIQILKNK